VKINRKIGLAIGAGVLSVGVFGAAGYAYFESSITPPADTAAVEPVATPASSASADPMPPQPAPYGMKELGKDLIAASATYLGMKPMYLAAQLKDGKSLADVATATTGKSRDGLVAALTTAATAKIDASVTDGTLTAGQAAMVKQKLPAAIMTFVDRTGHK